MLRRVLAVLGAMAVILVPLTTLATASPAAATAPVIALQPKDTCGLATASFSVALASGSPAATYQWQVRSGSTKAWSNLVNSTTVRGATGATLRLSGLTTADYTHFFRAVISTSDGNVASDEASLTYGAAPVVDTQPESVGVEAGTNATFTAAATGTPAPTVQWYWVNGLVNSPVTDATTTTLVIQPGGADSFTLFFARFSNSCGVASSNPADYNVAAPAAPVVEQVVPPAITGTAQVGSPLTATDGSWDPASAALSRRWFADGVFTGATGSTYTPLPADLGKTITFEVTGRMAGYASSTATESASTPVGVCTIVLTRAPDFTGAAAPGFTLHAVTGIYATPDLSSVSEQWFVTGSLVAVGTSYTVAAGDLGKVIYYQETAFKQDYLPLQTSSRGVQVEVGIDNSIAPSITGEARTDQVLTGHQGTWMAGADLTDQWLVDGDAVAGETGSNYVVRPSDVGMAISLQVTGTDPGYATTPATSAPVTATAAPIADTTSPRITGTPLVGTTLTAAHGTWSPSGATFSYQWLSNGIAIPAATGATYKLIASDRGKRISVMVTGAKAGYDTLTKTSAATATVKTPAHVTVAATSRTGKAHLTITVTATGTVPTGTVKITQGTRLLKSGVLKHGKVTVTVAGSRRRHAYTITYVGNRTVARRTVTVRVRIT